jgi:hypothetical protein
MSDEDKRALITIQLAKSKLYEAKVGVVEIQRRAHTQSGMLYDFTLDPLL